MDFEWCYNYPSVLINFNPCEDRVEVFRCRAKQIPEGLVASYSYNEWLNISNLQTELLKWRKWPENFPKNTVQCCPISAKECSCINTPISEVMVSFERHCNLHCSWCGANSYRQKSIEKHSLNLQRLLYFKTLEMLKNNGLHRIGLTENGEPFFFLNDTIDYLKSLTLKDTKQVQIITNGTLLNSEFFDILRNTEIQYRLTISINAWDRESYKAVTGADYFDKVMENVKTLHNILSMPYSPHSAALSFSFDSIEYAKGCLKFKDELKEKYPLFNFFCHPTFGNDTPQEIEVNKWWEENNLSKRG